MIYDGLSYLSWECVLKSNKKPSVDNESGISFENSMFMAVITKDWLIHDGHILGLMEIEWPDSQLISYLSGLRALTLRLPERQKAPTSLRSQSAKKRQV